VIVGVRTPEQVIDNMQAADWDLDEALWRQLKERTRPEEDYLTFFNRQNYERIFSAAEFHDEQLDLL
jgi:diketogulonate reductase-like aldo/keto reductase